MTATLEPKAASLAGFAGICPADVADPFDTVEWELRDTWVKDYKSGTALFEQKDVECPKHWSQEACNVAASKYFFGRLGKSERETSVRQLVHRVARTIADWGRDNNYFDKDEAEAFYRDLAYVLVHQYAAFNSPVWFNIGLYHIYKIVSGGGSKAYRYDPKTCMSVAVDPMMVPQGSACFILKMHDDIDEIWNRAGDSARLFKFGSGVGMDLSPLRSKYEFLSGGGKASGSISFGKVIDVTGGTIKSGGRTRRAAIMMTLKDWHPEFEDFIELKMKEEEKAKALIKAGYDPDFNGEAYGTVAFQNANLSVRLSDEFMQASQTGGDWQTHWVTDPKVKGPRYKAETLLKKIAKATYVCGDPGVQFETTIQRYHTCPNTDRINSSNPCSEFKFLDDTSCNLASLRLTKFRKPDGSIDVDLYRKVLKVMFWAQEILVGCVSYPTPRVAEMSYKYRPLGIGYADLGALLMVQGLPYDSDEGRTLAGAMTAIMTGESYYQSAKMAERLGAFEGFEKNREPMLGVIQLHRAAVNRLDPTLCPDNLRDAAYACWDKALTEGEKHGYRNAQASVLAPTGTISFLMDCDTTGVEPELGLVKYKVLAGGGNMKLTNKLVNEALVKLGYDKSTRDKIVAYVCDKGGMEGCPDLAEEHLPVFDTSFAMPGGSRVIHWKAHVDMMAATQPFISGAISKTVNLPKEATEEEIQEAIVDAWRKEIKALAMYRDQSKWSQPLSTSVDGNNRTSDEAQVVVAPYGSRKKLPKTRDSRTHHFSIAGHDGYIMAGMYEDGKLGEVFIKMNKEGSTASGLMDAIGILASIGLQHGVPLSLLVEKLQYMDFEPRGFTGDRDIPMAKSVVDYVFRWLDLEFGPDKISPQVEVRVATATEDKTVEAIVTGPPCKKCGAMTQMAGRCFYCRSCGESQGGCG
jgi:ribonucleoside-diphosphate reductase alpha chain